MGDPAMLRTRLRRLDLLENNLLPEQGELLWRSLKRWQPACWPAPRWNKAGDPPTWKLPPIPPKARCPLQALLVDITLPDATFLKLWRNGASAGSGKNGKKKKK